MAVFEMEILATRTVGAVSYVMKSFADLCLVKMIVDSSSSQFMLSMSEAAVNSPFTYSIEFVIFAYFSFVFVTVNKRLRCLEITNGL